MKRKRRRRRRRRTVSRQTYIYIFLLHFSSYGGGEGGRGREGRGRGRYLLHLCITKRKRRRRRRRRRKRINTALLSLLVYPQIILSFSSLVRHPFLLAGEGWGRGGSVAGEGGSLTLPLHSAGGVWGGQKTIPQPPSKSICFPLPSVSLSWAGWATFGRG